MPIKSEKYRCRTEQEAIAWIEREAGQKMYPCVYPSRMGHDYYIGKDGTLFASRYYNEARYYLVYRIYPVVSQFFRNKDKAYTLASTERIEGVLVQRLVYCTFVLGYWDTKTSILFKDGNHQNCHIDNLTAKVTAGIDSLTGKDADAMRTYQQDYTKHFPTICNYLRWFARLNKQEAEDCTQDAFIRIVEEVARLNRDHFVGYWIVMARKMSLQYVRQRLIHVDIDSTKPLWTRAPECGIDLLSILPNETHREIIMLMADGYTMTQVGDMLGMSKSQIDKRQIKAKRILRDYLKTDKEIMKQYE
ncbi:MAG: sigma-70 family RNA polymerase sigma factor [Paludibacteraceae bacterium]|nr:sigma-70 family RNA polymerase sigma factor [Paludibacteraceae bacterium]